MTVDAEKITVDTIIVSDVHLGSDVCHAEALLEALRGFCFRRLILNGDIFDRLDMTPASQGPRRRLPEELDHPNGTKERKQRLSKSHIKVLEFFSGLSKPENQCEVVWVEGNHDEGLQKLSFLFGAQVHWVYSWEYRGRVFMVIHGDQFDQFMQANPFTVHFFAWLYLKIQLMFPTSYRLLGIFKRSSKHYVRAVDEVAKGVFKYAKEKGAAYVFCGHTHMAEWRTDEPVTYMNSGCWTDVDCSLVAIGEEHVRVYQFHVDGHRVVSKKIIAEVPLPRMA